jgi:hypothetical protein
MSVLIDVLRLFADAKTTKNKRWTLQNKQQSQDVKRFIIIIIIIIIINMLKTVRVYRLWLISANIFQRYSFQKNTIQQQFFKQIIKLL